MRKTRSSGFSRAIFVSLLILGAILFLVFTYRAATAPTETRSRAEVGDYTFEQWNFTSDTESWNASAGSATASDGKLLLAFGKSVGSSELTYTGDLSYLKDITGRKLTVFMRLRHATESGVLGAEMRAQSDVIPDAPGWFSYFPPKIKNFFELLYWLVIVAKRPSDMSYLLDEFIHPPTETPTPTEEPTLTGTPTQTPTDVPTSTSTPTRTPTLVPTLTVTPTTIPATSTPTPSSTPTNTPTTTPTRTPTPTTIPVYNGTMQISLLVNGVPVVGTGGSTTIGLTVLESYPPQYVYPGYEAYEFTIPEGSINSLGLAVYYGAGYTHPEDVDVLIDWIQLSGSYPPTLDAQNPVTGPQDGCVITGCSNQLCADEQMTTTCEYLPLYQCYSLAICERQLGGHCGWTLTTDFFACKEENKTVVAQ